jgi:hypothetical protein
MLEEKIEIVGMQLSLANMGKAIWGQKKGTHNLRKTSRLTESSRQTIEEWFFRSIARKLIRLRERLPESGK